MHTSTTNKHTAADEAARLRSGLKHLRGSDVLRMVVTPRELDAIWAELAPHERKRIELLTSWPWDKPALVSAALARAA